MGRWGTNDGRRRGPALLVVLAAAVAGVLVPAGAAGAADGDVGVEGPAYVEGVLPTVTMAESKLWFHDGTWFAAMLRTGEPSSGGSPDADVVIHERVGSTWVPTSTVIDPRATAKQDVVSVGSTLFVLSHKKEDEAKGDVRTAPSDMTRLYTFTYDSATGAYAPVAGSPRVVNPYVVESITMDVDHTGALWVAWAQQGQVLWQRSTDGGATWSTPTALTVAHATPTTDDIASLVAFGDRVGIMWADQVGADDGYWFTSTPAGSGTPSWSATEAAFAGANRGDDHISLKSVGGRVVAAVKTRVGLSGNALIALLTRSTTGTWTATNAWAGTTEATRPIVTIDATNDVVHLFASVPDGSTTAEQGVYTKSTPLAAPAFTPASDGTPAMTRTGGDIADATSTKQPLTAASDLVVLAADTRTQRYWTHSAGIDAPPDLPPSAPGSVTATAGRRSATVSWTAATPGTTPITGYRITATPALPTAVPDQPATARGPITVSIPTGVARTFQVRALSGPLVGPPASSTSVTPNNHQPFASVAAFADRQAQDLFGRPATDQEKVTVQRILVTEDQPGSAAVLAPELFGHASVAGTTLKGLQAQVARLYLAYFLRVPDIGGLDYWIGRRRAGMGLEQVSQAFAASPEFRNLYGRLDDEGFVDLVYENLFDREPDADGREYWLSELARGVPRGRMMTLFSESPENVGRSGRTVSVALLYARMLGRVPTNTELQAEANRPSVAAVVDGILASAAYRTRVAS